MTYIVWFNRKYQRQFEAVVKRSAWKSCKARYGTLGAATLLVSRAFRVKHKRRSTSKKARLARRFIPGSYVNPAFYGSAIVKVGNSKKEILDRGHSELVIRGVKRYGGIEKTRRVR